MKLIYSLFIATACLIIPSLSFADGTPSFDCAKATIKTEHAICENMNLAVLDVEISHAYLSARLQVADTKLEEDLMKGQVVFVYERNKCSDDVECLNGIMKNRLAELISYDKNASGHATSVSLSPPVESAQSQEESDRVLTVEDIYQKFQIRSIRSSLVPGQQLKSNCLSTFQEMFPTDKHKVETTKDTLEIETDDWYYNITIENAVPPYTITFTDDAIFATYLVSATFLIDYNEEKDFWFAYNQIALELYNVAEDLKGPPSGEISIDDWIKTPKGCLVE